MGKPDPDNKHWLISQSELESWLDGIANARTLIAPRLEGGLCFIAP